MRWLSACLSAAAAATLAMPAPAQAQTLQASELSEHALQGFGDRYNSHAWGIIWWNGKLYVGTGRATHCVQQAMLAYFEPTIGDYPPVEEDLECTPDSFDLPLQAEIWRWTPETDTWDMLFRSPNDVPIQGTDPVKYTAREIGYRAMLVFQEADGTEALYVSGVSARGNQAGTGFAGPMPPPRILRSVDGETFAPLPQDPGTVLGDIAVSGFRTMLSFNGKFYVLGSYGLLGHGVVFEAANPELGNNAFRQISPPGKTFFEIETYNGHLWLGTGVQPANDPTLATLMKTDATGDPYTFTTIIPEGAYKKFGASPAIISLQEFDGRLFVGTDRELMRVNPDDSWDLVVGTPRKTPSGLKLRPLSGFDFGFDNIFNIHMWRMTAWRGSLLVGTQDQSTKWRNSAAGPILADRMGADLYGSSDGWHFTMITRKGFGDIFNNGVRNFASTPYGLFLGTANHYYGTRILKTSGAVSPVEPPRNFWLENRPQGAVLSWEASPGAARYQVYRDNFFGDPIGLAVVEATGPGVHSWMDHTVEAGKRYHYFVVAEDALGQVSGPSTMLSLPFAGPVPTFRTLRNFLRRYQAPPPLVDALVSARAEIDRRRFGAALALLEDLGEQVQADTTLPGWQVRDFDILLGQFARRVTLAQGGFLPPRALLRNRE